MNGSDFQTTVAKGNAFRDLVASMLDAAGFVAEPETRERFKRVDVRWRREDLDGPIKYVVEARDHAGTVALDECREFLMDYGTLLECGDADRAWFVSNGPLSPDGRALVDAKRGCKALCRASAPVAGPRQLPPRPPERVRGRGDR
jgi:hypothetical protein